MIYTGIGARNTPSDVLPRMRSLGRFMATWGHTLRSGGANGADLAFEQGCESQNGKMEIYLPFPKFNMNPSPLFGSTKEARMLAKEFHPAWNNLGNLGREFMARICYQVLGKDLKTPTDFLICWTPNGKITGGTGQALRMAEHYRIPIINLGSTSFADAESVIEKLLE